MNNDNSVQLHPEWLEWIGDEFDKAYMKELRQFLCREISQNKTIFPAGPDIFQALNSTLPSKTRVVLIGQDPYHGPGQAHGLSFSVRPGVRTPPSLVNIYKEMATDLNIPPVNHGYLKHWADEGVLLLNSVLTVESSKAASHAGKGWETFTDRVISELNNRKDNLVFFLWGSYAQKKGAHIDPTRHCVIKSVHPSPLSAHRGFLGSKPFSQANHYLSQKGYPSINWQLPQSVH